MRVFFSLGNFPPSNFGGIAHSMFSIINELNQQSDLDIYVLTTTYKIPVFSKIIPNKWMTYNNINVNYISSKYFPYILRLLFEGFNQITLAEKIHLSSIFYFPNFFFVIFSLITGKKVYISPHGELQKPALNRKYWKKAPYLNMLKPFFKKCLFIATSQLEYDRINHFFPHSSTVIIPNAFNYTEHISTKRKKQLIFIGRINKIKRLENLIYACSISKYFKSNNYKLLIVGPIDEPHNNYKLTLEKLIDEKKLCNYIKFIGNVNSPYKEKLLSASKCLLLISDSENFGNVVVESLMQGTPVIASKGTPWKSLETNNCGFWIENNPEAISEKIDEIIKMDDSTFKNISVNSKFHSLEFSSKKIIPKWIQLFSN